MKILIVDDSKGSRDVLKFLIDREKQFTIFEAANGIEALDIINTQGADIMITDIKMPRMDGLKLIEETRKISPNMQIIVFSAFGNFEFAKKAMKFGVTDYLLKPINTDEFYKTFSNVIEKCNSENNNIILEQLDALTLIPPENDSPLPASLSKYNSLFIFNTPTEHLSEIEAYIEEKFAGSIIKRKTNELLVLAQNSQPSAPLFTAEIYNELYKKNPCWAYCAEFKNSILDFYNTYNALIHEKNEDIFWQKNKRFYYLTDINKEPKDITYLFSKTHKLCDDILRDSGNYTEKIQRFFDELIHNCITSKQCKLITLEMIKQFFVAIASPFSYEKTIDNINSATNINEIIKILINTVSDIINPEKTNYDYEYTSIIRTAIDIIHNEYMNDISRTDVAKQIFMSASYFSHIFKKEIGKSFTEYLNDYRMEKACLLLKNTTKNIHAIAKTVGFTNYPYFCSQFKKKYGQTCIQYRETYFKAIKNESIKKEGD